MASKAKGKHRKAVASTSTKTVRKPRQSRLPGMEDEKLEELHGLAEDYVAVRDRRIALNREEKPLKDNLLAAMHAHGKAHYHHESEKMKVKLHKDVESEAQD